MRPVSAHTGKEEIIEVVNCRVLGRVDAVLRADTLAP
jgi:hypothetical protein